MDIRQNKMVTPKKEEKNEMNLIIDPGYFLGSFQASELEGETQTQPR